MKFAHQTDTLTHHNQSALDESLLKILQSYSALKHEQLLKKFDILIKNSLLNYAYM